MKKVAPTRGTEAVWKKRQEANGVNLRKEECTPLEAKVGEVWLFGGDQLQPQQRQALGQEGCAVTTSSSPGCPLGSESGLVGSPFPIIVGAQGVYSVCSGSLSTSTLCSPLTSVRAHLRLQPDGLCVWDTSGLSVPLKGIKK